MVGGGGVSVVLIVGYGEGENSAQRAWRKFAENQQLRANFFLSTIYICTKNKRKSLYVKDSVESQGMPRSDNQLAMLKWKSGLMKWISVFRLRDKKITRDKATRCSSCGLCLWAPL